MTVFVCVVCSAPAKSLRACTECGALVAYSLQSRVGPEVFGTLLDAPAVATDADDEQRREAS